MKQIIHIITGLNYGGAEIMLYRLLLQMRTGDFSHHVISLTSVGAVGELMKKAGIQVESLEMENLNFNPKYLLRLCLLIKKKMLV